MVSWEPIWLGVGIANKAKCDSNMRSESMLGMGKGRSPVTFMKAGFLERWRQMTDGSVLRREWEVRRGGGKPPHHGKEQERELWWEGKAESRESCF